MDETFVRIRTKTLFFDVDYKTLLLLYQPILSAKAISLYLIMLNLYPFFFYQERNRYITYGLLFRVLQVSDVEFLLLRKQLESVNLLKTYQNQEGDQAHHCLVLFPPITPNSFFKHSFLCARLKLKIGDVHLEFIKQLFRVKNPVSTMGINISASNESLTNLRKQINDAHAIPLNEQLLSRRKNKEIILGWEWLRTLNKQSLAIAWTTEQIDYFCTLRYVYNLADELISKLLLNNLIGNHELDMRALKRDANSVITKTLKNFTTVAAVTKLSSRNKNIIDASELMSNLSTLEFYVYIYKTIPAKSMLASLIKLKQKYNLNYAVLNCLLDFSYIKNKELVLAYIDKICGTLADKSLTNLEVVMNHLRNAYLSKQHGERKSRYFKSNLNNE